MSEHGFEFRRTEESDLRAAYQVFAAAEGALWRRHHLEWAAPPLEVWSAPHRHLLAEDGGGHSWHAMASDWPLAGRNGEAAAVALQAELARRESQHADVHVPGSARRLVETGLASGLRATRPPGLLLLSERSAPPQALAISSYWLF